MKTFILDNGQVFCETDFPYHDSNAFTSGVGICYIPENAENESDFFTKQDLLNEVNSFLSSNPDYLIEHETTQEDVLTNMFECLTWEFPATFLDQLNY